MRSRARRAIRDRKLDVTGVMMYVYMLWCVCVCVSFAHARARIQSVLCWKLSQASQSQVWPECIKFHQLPQNTTGKIQMR